MPVIRVKKVVALCFLEAAKLTLEHLRAFRLDLSQKGAPGPSDLPRQYGELRRLRDCLQRCTSAYQEIVQIELSDGDAGLLVCCCRRAIEDIELRLAERALVPDEKKWLQKKHVVLADWAVELARKPLVDLPLLRLSPITGEATRALNVRLQAKVYGGIESQKLIVPPKSGPGTPAPGLERLAEQVSESGEATAPALPPLPASDPFAGPLAFESSLPKARAPGVRAPMIDKRKLSDPRLRAQLGIDLAAFTRCVEASDYRLATVLLASILEAALLDHAIPRRMELGLTGTPETWNMQDVLLRALGPEAEVKDPALAFHLFTSRNLMRPALQMITPTVVTASSLSRLREFAERVLHSLGFGRTPEMLASDEFGEFDLPMPSFDD